MAWHRRPADPPAEAPASEPATLPEATPTSPATEVARSDRLSLAWPATLRGPRPRRGIRIQEMGIVGICVALFLTLTIATPAFFTFRNLRNILDQNSAVGIMACGETLVIISGSFDLSVGATYAFAGLVAVQLGNVAGPEIGIAVALVSGLFLGSVNGAVVVFCRIHSFIATLASEYIFNGLALVISGGLIMVSTRPAFTVIGMDFGLDINYTIWILVAVVAATWLLLTRTVWGRYVCAAGGNLEAARLSGIRTGFTRGSVFAVSGLCAALAGVIGASRVGTATAGSGAGLELAAIATTILGGTSIFGGEGAIWRTVLGVFLIAMIGNGFDLLGFPTTYQQIVEGALIILAVTIDAYTRLRR